MKALRRRAVYRSLYAPSRVDEILFLLYQPRAASQFLQGKVNTELACFLVMSHSRFRVPSDHNYDNYDLRLTPIKTNLEIMSRHCFEAVKLGGVEGDTTFRSPCGIPRKPCTPPCCLHSRISITTRLLVYHDSGASTSCWSNAVQIVRDRTLPAWQDFAPDYTSSHEVRS